MRTSRRWARCWTKGDAGLVVVYASDMADRVNAGLGAPTHSVRKTTSVTADRLAADIEEAEERVRTRARAASAAAGPDSGRAKTN